MTNKQAIDIIRKEYKCVNRDCDIERSCGKCELMMPSKEPILKAYEMAIQALSQEPCTDAVSRDAVMKIVDEEWICNADYDFRSLVESIEKLPSVTQKPIECDDAISRDAVIMECIKYADHEHNVRLKKEVSETRKHDAQVIIYACGYFKTFVEKLPSVTQKSGKWIKVKSGDKDFPESIVCSRCSNENSHLDFNENAEPIGKVFVTSKFCPNCGARMESEVRNEKSHE